MFSGLRRVWEMLPGGPALSGQQCRSFVNDPPPAEVDYLTGPVVPFPVLPVQVWGLYYDLDLVLVSDHPDWTMHEYARIELPGGPIWMAKDADTTNEQFVVADLPDLLEWLPEIPVRRRRAPLEVTDRSVARLVDVDLSYINHADQAVRVSFRGKRPLGAPRKRNGSTMGHSRGSVAVVLDLAGQTHGGCAAIEFSGQSARIERLLGFYRMQFVLAQAQGGFARASFSQSLSEGGFRLVRPISGVDWPTRAEERWVCDSGRVRREGGPVSLCYRFAAGEWQGATVIQEGHGLVLEVQLDRSLPDLRRRF